MKVAVVTPYHKEPEAMLAHCCDSVRNQSYPCTHIMVADGHPRPMIDHMPGVLHVTLPIENGDFGNTPRAIGGLLAEAYGFNAVAWLDADNRFDVSHIENLVTTAEKHPTVQLVSCRRRFQDMHYNDLGITEPDEDLLRHVDTNCWLVLRSGFAALRFWLLPKALSGIGDRLFLARIVHDGFRHIATPERTVGYRTLWASHYLQAGMVPPPGARDFDATEVMQFVNSPEGSAEVMRVMGFRPMFG